MDSSNSSSMNDGEVQEVIVQTRSSELIVLHDVSSQTDQAMYSSNAEFQAYSVRKFNELKVAINQVRDLVLASAISPQSSTDNMSNDFEEHETIFPVLSYPDWESFNASLAEETRKQQVLKYLQSMGGVDLKEAVSRMLRSIITDEVTSLYSWKGGKGKKKFNSLLIVPLIIKAVRMHKKMSVQESTVSEVEKCIIAFVVHATDRMKRKLNRAGKNSETTGDEVDT
ncbi:unnamed protein product [Allacma fusca]|uniref:DUF4806 domain-containing protein n=1 Tax=Allacma fusca TaxID=39272 RepID=A0A8J2PAZ4_9HEXA|nr:unnamed protein product [Allacma fusca]